MWWPQLSFSPPPPLSQLSKRDLQLVDRSGKVVSLTLWGAEAEGFDGSQFPVIVVKGCKVRYSTLPCTQFRK